MVIEEEERESKFFVIRLTALTAASLAREERSAPTYLFYPKKRGEKKRESKR
jgi:hypothetical protein